MKNAERYKDAMERAEAFREYTNGCTYANQYVYMERAFEWLDFEAEEEKPLPCPFCGASEYLLRETNGAKSWLVHCYCCGYRSKSSPSEEVAIAAHNRVARAVAKDKEANV